jgi:phosphate transport system substrate-binding protein
LNEGNLPDAGGQGGSGRVRQTLAGIMWSDVQRAMGRWSVWGRRLGAPLVAALALATIGCDVKDAELSGAPPSGTIDIDGSATTAPFTSAAASEFERKNPDTRVRVGAAGTGEGFDRLCRGEIEIATASRAITKAEREACGKSGIETSPVQVANDGVTVISNRDVDIGCATTDELRRLFGRGSKARRFADVNPRWPKTPIVLYSPGEESGTFRVFTREALGGEGAQRPTLTSSDPYEIFLGISRTPGGLGYLGFGLRILQQNRDQLNVIAVDGGRGCVLPTIQTIRDGSYQPLSRPLLMYPNEKALRRPEVAAFMRSVVENAQRIAAERTIVPLTDQQVTEAKTALGRLTRQ